MARTFIEYPKQSTQSPMASNDIYEVISPKYATDHFEIQEIINRLTVDDRRVVASAQVRAYTMRQ